MPTIPRTMINPEYITVIIDELLIEAGTEHTCRQTGETESGITLEIRPRIIARTINTQE